jgi:predicted DNA-binding transcriptional regulator AlpA
MLVTISKVANLAGVSESTIRLWYKKGKMPQPIQYTERGWCLWDYDTMKQWLADNGHPSAIAPPAVEHASDSARQSGN